MPKFSYLIACFLLLALAGAGGLVRVWSKPEFDIYRTVDVVQLTGSGFCFGIAFAALIAAILVKRR